MSACALDIVRDVTYGPIPFDERSCCLLHRLGTETNKCEKADLALGSNDSMVDPRSTYRLDIAFLKAIDLEFVREVTSLIECAQRLIESLVL